MMLILGGMGNRTPLPVAFGATLLIGMAGAGEEKPFV